LELKNFQIEASEQIAERYESYMNDPLYIRKNEIVPFYQNLYWLIYGKREKLLVLADAIEQIRVDDHNTAGCASGCQKER